MKTVLIVEDEKLIRQGIKTMIQRSGVPVDVIMECGNGEMALEVLREQKIDVMFTDIRMPKMDGIELVKRMQECEHIPLTVAVSGYDDFSYAVEMLRNGVREYILKPVEREKIAEILKKLDDEIENNQEIVKTRQKLGYQQMKHLMLLSDTTEEEVRVLEEQYRAEFYPGSYAVCCRNAREYPKTDGDNYIYLKDIEGADVFVVPQENLELLLKKELRDGYVGVSAFHTGLGGLRSAWQEAQQMRRAAFCRNGKAVFFGETEEKIPEKLVLAAEKLLDAAEAQKRVQLLGTDRTEELEKQWRSFFFEVKNGRIAPERYEECMEEFFREFSKTWQKLPDENAGELEELCAIWQEDCIDLYEERFMEWLLFMQEKIAGLPDNGGNSRKIRQAVEYIEQNYANDLNMAVVSNHISMNYSLFSYSFKQYTGSNFVNFLKDIRMREARKLLADTDMRIIEISQKVGYDNEKHFMKLFKASYGVSPSEYRRNVRGK